MTSVEASGSLATMLDLVSLFQGFTGVGTLAAGVVTALQLVGLRRDLAKPLLKGLSEGPAAPIAITNKDIPEKLVNTLVEDILRNE